MHISLREPKWRVVAAMLTMLISSGNLLFVSQIVPAILRLEDAKFLSFRISFPGSKF